jgi:hypothetical protein
VVFVALAVATVLPVGCGGEDGSKMHATLTDDDCTYEGNTTHAAGMFSIEIENQTADSGSFGYARLGDGFVFEDIEPLLDERVQLEAQGETPRDHLPPWLRGVLRSAIVDGGASTFLPVDVTPGTYALVCWDIDQGKERAEVATRLDVTG